MSQIQKIKVKDRFRKKRLKLEVSKIDKLSFVNLGEKYSRVKVDEEGGRLILNQNYYAWVYVGMTFFVFLLLILLGRNDEGFLKCLIPTGVGALVISLFWLFTKPSQIIIFDRINGTITYPGFWWSSPIYTKFDDVVAIISNTGKGQSLKLCHPNLFTNCIVGSNGASLRAQWSYYVWYMDKNRPLPPGSAFDSYRDKDFERRKSLGFPDPLYLSVIETPEANSYQQHERDQYWKESPFSNESERGVVIQKNHHSHKQYSDEVKAKVKKMNSNVELFDIKVHVDWTRTRCIDEGVNQPMINTYFIYKMKNGVDVLVKSDINGNSYRPPLGTYNSVKIINKDNYTN